MYRSIGRCQTTVSTRPKKYCQWTFPWWCIFVAYGLAFLTIMVSIVIIIALGIEFGDNKTQKWLISLMISFCSSVLLTQPLKVNYDSLRINVHRHSVRFCVWRCFSHTAVLMIMLIMILLDISTMMTT